MTNPFLGNSSLSDRSEPTTWTTPLGSRVRTESKAFPDLLPMLNRSEGVHLSQVLHSICVEQGHYEEYGDDDPDSETRMMLGRAWEYALIDMWRRNDPSRYISAGEVEHQRVFNTPDIFDVVEGRVIEIKSTWMSARHGDDPSSVKLWKFFTQLKAYCKVLNVRKGMLSVVFINGYYPHGAPKPTYREFDWEFSKADLESNWRMIITQARNRFGL